MKGHNITVNMESGFYVDFADSTFPADSMCPMPTDSILIFVQFVGDNMN